MRFFPALAIVLIFFIIFISGCLESSGDVVTEFEGESGDAIAIADNSVYAAYFSDMEIIDQRVRSCENEIASEIYETGAFQSQQEALTTVNQIFGCETVLQKQSTDQGDGVFVVRYIQQTVASCPTYSSFYCDVTVDLKTNDYSADCANNAIFLTDYSQKISELASTSECTEFAEAYISSLVQTNSVTDWSL